MLRRTTLPLTHVGLCLASLWSGCETGKTPPESPSTEPSFEFTDGMFVFSDGGVLSGFGADDPLNEVPVWSPSTATQSAVGIAWREPAPNASRVDPRARVEVDFDIPVSVAVVLVFDETDGVEVTGTNDFLGDHVSWRPTRPLRFGHTYAVQLFMDSLQTTWSFTVEPQTSTPLPTAVDAVFSEQGTNMMWGVSRQDETLVALDPAMLPARTAPLEFTPNDVCRGEDAVFVAARDGSVVAELDPATLAPRRKVTWTEPTQPLDTARGTRVHCSWDRLWLIDGTSPAGIWSVDLDVSERSVQRHAIDLPAASILQDIAAPSDSTALYVSSLENASDGARLHVQRYDTQTWALTSSTSVDVRARGPEEAPLPMFFAATGQHVITANYVFAASDLRAVTLTVDAGEVVMAVSPEHQLLATATQVYSLIDFTSLARVSPALGALRLFDADGTLYATDSSLSTLITLWLYQ